MLMEGIQATNLTIDNESESELSIVSSSRFLGLKEDFWKEKSAVGCDFAKIMATAMSLVTIQIIGTALETVQTTVTVMCIRSKGKRVHWE